MMEAKKQLILRNGIAVSNLAVNLLQKHCYLQALHTLHDGLALFKKCLGSQLDDSVSSFAEAAHDNAFKRFANPMPLTPIASIESRTYSPGRHELHLAQNDNTSSSSQLCAIRWEDFSSAESYDDVFMAILLHNLSIAYLAMYRLSAQDCSFSNLSPTSSRRAIVAKYREAAIKNSNLSRCLCQKRFSDGSLNILDKRELLSISAITLGVQIHSASDEQGRDHPRAFFRQIQEAISQIDQQVSYLPKETPYAPAA